MTSRTTSFLYGEWNCHAQTGPNHSWSGGTSYGNPGWSGTNHGCHKWSPQTSYGCHNWSAPADVAAITGPGDHLWQPWLVPALMSKFAITIHCTILTVLLSTALLQSLYHYHMGQVGLYCGLQCTLSTISRNLTVRPIPLYHMKQVGLCCGLQCTLSTISSILTVRPIPLYHMGQVGLGTVLWTA